MRVVEVKLTLRGALTFELDSSGAQRPPFLVAALTTMHLTKSGEERLSSLCQHMRIPRLTLFLRFSDFFVSPCVHNSSLNADVEELHGSLYQLLRRWHDMDIKSAGVQSWCRKLSLILPDPHSTFIHHPFKNPPGYPLVRFRPKWMHVFSLKVFHFTP